MERAKRIIEFVSLVLCRTTYYCFHTSFLLTQFTDIFLEESSVGFIP